MTWMTWKTAQGTVPAWKKRRNDCVAYRIAIDEDTDVSDVMQLAVFTRGVNEDCQLIVELLDLHPMK
jgi:hypothetical protein